jgi:hypothetical protein
MYPLCQGKGISKGISKYGRGQMNLSVIEKEAKKGEK